MIPRNGGEQYWLVWGAKKPPVLDRRLNSDTVFCDPLNTCEFSFGAKLRRRRGDAGYERFEVAAADGVLQLGNRFGFNLPHAFAGDLEDAADFLERVGISVGQTVAEADDFPFTEGESLQQFLDPLAEEAVVGQFVRGFGTLVLTELAKAAVIALANRAVEANRVPADIQHAFGFFQRDAGSDRGFLGRRLAAHLLQQLLGGVAELHQHVDHVNRDADRAGLVGDRT